MLQIFVSCLIISSVLATSADKCKVGNITFTDFDINKYFGTWYELYRIPNSAEKDLTCEAEQYFKIENEIVIYCVAYNTSKRGIQTLNGMLHHWTDNGFNSTYYDGQVWTNRYWVAGTDYKTYSILRACMDDNYEHPMTWVYSRGTSMNSDSKKEVNKILKNFDLSLDDFEPVNQVDCGKYESS